MIARTAELGNWPGQWVQDAPTVGQHPKGRELAWVVRGHPFTRPVLARTSVGVKKSIRGFEPFVVVQIMADGFYGLHLHATQHEVSGLEWLGPLLIPDSATSTTSAQEE